MTKNKFHRYQEESGWCGPACIQMIMFMAGKRMSQKTIAKIIYDPSWGTPYANIFSYLNDYFASVGQQSGIRDKRIATLLKNGYGIIANIMSHDEDGSGGHYVVVGGIDESAKKYLILDPSNAARLDGKKGIYELSYDEMDQDWYDFATTEHETQKIPTHRWVTFVKLNTLK
jgi:hypothetical protein